MPTDMQNELKKEISKYLKNIKHLLPGDKESKTEFIDGLTEQIEDFVAENEDATFHDILLTFGEPKEIADEYSAGMEAQEIKKSTSIKKAIIIALVVAIVIWGVAVMTGAAISRVEEQKDYTVFTTNLQTDFN